MVRTVAAALISTGLADLGYTMLELDDGWPAAQRDNQSGAIVADPELFPSGIKRLTTDLAAMNPPLHFGLYTDRGPTTCGGKPGSAGHEAQDAATYISWGVRQVKSDSCGGVNEHTAAIKQYGLMQSALAKAPAASPVFFNLCGWFNFYGAAGPRANVGQAYRLATDCIGYEQMLLNIDAVAPVAQFLGEGHFADMDMIAATATRYPRSQRNAGPRGPGSVVAKRVQTQFSLIAVTGAVLLLSFDVRDARNAELVRITSNKDIITVHQDHSAKGASQRIKGGALAESIKEMVSEAKCGSLQSNWKFTKNTTAPGTTGSFESLSRPGWCLSASSGNGPNTCGAAMASLQKCGSFVLGTYCGMIDQWVLGNNGSIQSVKAGSHSYLTADMDNISGALWIQPAVPSNKELQTWAWDPVNGTLRYASGQCLGAPSAPTQNVNVWSRTLRNGSIALVFVNAEKSAEKVLVECTWKDCLSKVAGIKASTSLTARNLVDPGTPHRKIIAKDGLGVGVVGGGGSETWLLAPQPQ
jgi:hypothetical protein